MEFIYCRINNVYHSYHSFIYRGSEIYYQRFNTGSAKIEEKEVSVWFYKVVELEKNLWAINEINKTILYFINGEKAVLLIDTGLGLSPLKKNYPAILRREGS